MRLTIATNAAPGEREIRLATATGLSNPMKFLCRRIAGILRAARRPPNPEEDRLRRQFNLPPAETPSTNIARVTLPAVINGQIMPGEVDRYRFSARRGQSPSRCRKCARFDSISGRRVPGWFQATIALYDAKCKENLPTMMIFASNLIRCCTSRFRVMVITLWRSRTASIAGARDFVYRIALGELPFVTSLFPLGGRVGSGRQSN